MESQLRDLQMKELAILKEVKRICKKYNLKYYLSGGTLLGAVRHQGFIPWNDDIDIMMPYNDYLKFLELAPRELDKNLFIQNHTTDLHYMYAFTKIRMNDTAMILPNHKRWKVHQGIWVDIFPLISIMDSNDLKRRKRILSISYFIQMDTFILDNEQEFREIMGFFYYFYRLFLLIPLSFRVKINKSLLKYAYRECDSKYFTEAWITMTNIYRKELMNGKQTDLLFENDSFSVLPGYKEYLVETYGDYMQLPPVEERKGHGYLIVDTHNSYKYILKSI